jgi:hypothetical protein
MGRNSLTTGLCIVAVAYGAAACRSNKKDTTPVAQIQTQTPPQAVNQPVTVTGCLRAGDASDTFVLTTSETRDGATPATYVVVSNTSGVNLRDNIGERIEVTGVLTTQQQASTTTPPAPPANKPTGTAGTPKMQTQAELDMRRIAVNSVNRVGGHCDTK